MTCPTRRAKQSVSILAAVILQLSTVVAMGRPDNGSAMPDPRTGAAASQQEQKKTPGQENQAAQQNPPAQQGQSQSQKDQSGAQITLSTSEVVLDVVVRDKKGRPVKDLAASDFEVYENGKKQEVESFRLHDREPGPQGPSVPSPPVVAEDQTSLHPGPARNPFTGVNVVAMVFDRLDLSGTVLAQKAALKYVSSTFTPNDFAGVFSIDLTLRILEPFTNNRDLINNGIARMTPKYAGAQNAVSTGGADVSQYLSDLTGTNSASVPEAGQAFLAPGTAAGVVLTMNVARAFQTLERNQQSYAEIYSLLAIVNALRAVEGRKAVVVFSEGLSVTSDTVDKFRALIDAANRANVTFYTIDAAGLRARSTNLATARALNRLAARRADSSLSGSEDVSGGPLTYDLEDNETLLRLDPAANLTQLADQTGGFFINQTNDLNPGLLRIGEDIRSYYVLTYAPLNQEYDGRFRKISVKVNRPGLEVETRKGYYAIRKPNPMPVSDWETAPLAMLKSGASENALTMRAKVFSFPEEGKPGLAPVIVEAPAHTFTYEVDKDKNIYKSDFSIVVVVKDLSDQIVAKVGNHYQITGPADKVDQARRGDIIFYRETDLDPGLYFVEAIAYDNATGKASIKTTSIEAPYFNTNSVPRLSSLIVLRSAEPLSGANQKENNPFHYGQTLLYPNMGEPLSKSKNKQLAFYFDVYPEKKGPAPALTIEILHDGQPLTSGSPALGPADETGRIQYVSALPLGGFQPGDYALKVTVTQGKAAISRVASFTVQP